MVNMYKALEKDKNNDSEEKKTGHDEGKFKYYLANVITTLEHKFGLLASNLSVSLSYFSYFSATWAT